MPEQVANVIPEGAIPFIVVFQHLENRQTLARYNGSWAGAVVFAKQREDELNAKQITEVKSITAM